MSTLATVWFLEEWNISNAVIGMIAVMSIQRALFKMLISLFLSREFKHDQTNRAFWSGKCTSCSLLVVALSSFLNLGSGIGMGSAAWSQPFRELIVKIVETSLFSMDFIVIHCEVSIGDLMNFG